FAPPRYRAIIQNITLPSQSPIQKQMLNRDLFPVLFGRLHIGINDMRRVAFSADSQVSLSNARWVAASPAPIRGKQ
ncbi:hypothetical protein, partial [Paraburkholderia graminis]|uniref:hypothetical protein n=1 Tax=Paraburkholderia graminis TaxID=60548 RepID=UPI00286B1B2C